MAVPARKRDRFELRATSQQSALIRKAAERSGRSYTDFILDSATEKAVDVLADRRLFLLDEDRWNRFMEALDTPAQPVPALVALIKDNSI
jgi:uncharacterized protein (DUF1778 family)